MKFQVRHIIYLVGLVTVLLSYVFWAVISGSSLILIGGLLTSTLAFLFILFKDRWKIISISLALAILTLVIKLTLREYLIGISYNIILTRNKKIFEKANNILISKKENVSYPPVPGDKDSIFSISEIQILNQFINETSINYIRKDDQKIFYPIWGIPLEMDYGLFYFYSETIPTAYFNHIKSKWYFDK